MIPTRTKFHHRKFKITHLHCPPNPSLYILCTNCLKNQQNLPSKDQFNHLTPPRKINEIRDLTGEGLDDGVVPWVRQVLHQVLKWPLPGHIVLNQEPQERQHRQSPVGELLLLVLEGGGEVERVEDAAGVAAFVRREAVALEDGVLVDGSRVLDVLPPPDLDVVEEDELDDEERGRRREVGLLDRKSTRLNSSHQI